MAWGLAGVLSASAGSAFIEFDQGLVFPQELGDMACQKTEMYDNTSLGYSVFYRLGDTFSAEVTVLDLGRTSIGTGPKAEGVDVVLSGCESWLQHQMEQGEVAGVKKRGTLTVPKQGDVQFINAVYQFSEPRVDEGLTNAIPRIASFYATAARGQFVKVDFRFDLAESDKARAMSEQLVHQLVDLLKTKPTEEEMLLAACEAAIYNPSDYGGRTAAQRVFEKAQTMGNLSIYSAFFVWPQEGYSKPKNADLLLAAYFAGMLKAILPQHLESGGDFEAFEAMLQAYEAMRQRGDIESIPRLEEWAKADDKAELYKQLLVEFEYAASE